MYNSANGGCKVENENVSGFIRELENEIDSHRLIGHVERIPAREAQHRQPDAELHPLVQAALSAKGVARTYTHQAEAIDYVMGGENVVISTSTASGKSVCFHAPVLHTLLDDPEARALYLFPTKALGHDQLAAMRELMDGGGIGISCDTYDGDTRKVDRAAIRANSRIIISNVDMMQYSILPQHSVWRKFLSNLKYVVVDEAHYYRGVFGSHVAMLMRRLRRVLRQLGADAQFILCSATIANPGQHAEKLVGTPFRVVDTDGSPSGGRAYVLLDTVSAEENNGSRGINMQAASVTAGLMRRDVKTLTFAQNRAGVERIVQYTEEMLNGTRSGRYRRPDLVGRVKPYRAGYLAEDRREVERGLRSGKLLAVASTNALELGIDVGSISATVIAGFPGTIASAWQQAGRSGRTGKMCLSLMLLRDNPVDAFYMRFPTAFFGAAHESAQVSLENEYIVGAHLECAAWELPLSAHDFEFFGEKVLRSTARTLVDQGRLVVGPDGKRRLPRGAPNPCFGINIRSSDGDRYYIMDKWNGRKLEETSRLYALKELYPGAVYSHKGQAYRVVAFDERGQEAQLVRLEERIYTEPVYETSVEILEEGETAQVGDTKIGTGKVKVTSRIVGYYEKDLFARHDGGEYHEVDMPAFEFETTAAWFCDRGPNKPESEMPALHAIAHVGTGALAMLTMCDTRDLGGVAMVEHPQLGCSAAFIYEEDVGGVGLVEFISEEPELFVERMADMVISCRCDDGCPSCIESARCREGDMVEATKEALLDYLET